MDKNWSVGIRKVSSICVVAGMLLNLFLYDAVLASADSSAELPESVTGPAITVTTENAESSKSYDIQVEWGNMQFVYDYAEPKWDTDTLLYSESAQEGWVASGFNGTNNKVQISNRSNAEITVDLTISIQNGVFNEDSSTDDVQAWFYDTAEQALQASKILTGLNEAPFAGRISNLVLDSAEAVLDEDGNIITAAGVRTQDAYFAFSGTPDRTLNTATEVGSISLVFSDTSDE